MCFKLFKLLILSVMMISCSSSPISSNSENLSRNPANTPSQNKTPQSQKNVKTDNKLQQQTDALLHFFDMQAVPVFINDEPVLKKGSETQKGVAYTKCESKNPSIIMKRIFYEKANEKQLTNILKHELTHAWLCRKGMMATGHGKEFRDKFKQSGGIGN